MVLRSRESIAFFYHYLMADSLPSFIGIYSLLLCKLSYLPLLYKTRFRFILHVVLSDRVQFSTEKSNH